MVGCRDGLVLVFGDFVAFPINIHRVSFGGVVLLCS